MKIKLNRLLRCTKVMAMVAALGLAVSSQAQILVNLGPNPPITFDAAPTLTVDQWATLTAGVGAAGAGTFLTPAALDAGANTVDQTTINLALPTFAGAYGTSGNGRHKTDSGELVLQPTGVGSAVILARLRNNSGGTLTALSLSYDHRTFGGIPTGGSEDTEVPGLRVYYSLTGSPGSWTHIPSLQMPLGVSSSNLSASLSLGTWAAGSDMYLMWLDDNANTNPDGTNAIDNVVFTGQVDTCVGFTAGPANISVPERGAVSFSITATGTPQTIRWFRSDNGGASYAEIPGANASTYGFLNAQYPGDNGAKFYATVSNSLCQATSSVATLTVIQDAVPPTVVRAFSGPKTTNVTVLFSEAMNPATVDAGNLTVFPTGTDPDASPITIQGVALVNGTNITIITDPLTIGENYSVRLLSLQDASSANNTIDPDPTIVDLAVHVQPVQFSRTGPGEAAAFALDDIWKHTPETNFVTLAGWETVIYDDSGWTSGGQAPLGVDASAGTGVQPPIITPTAYAAHSEPHFYRRHFTMPPFVPAQTTFTLRHVFEDGAVVFINGQEAGRYNVTAGTALVDGVRATGAATDPTPVSAALPLPLTNVVIGDNVIAVVVIQSGATSSDSVMALELNVDMPEWPSGPAQITVNPITSTNVNEGQPFSLTSGAKGALPLHTEWRRGATVVGSDPTFAVAAALPTDAGSYRFYASNSLGQATSTVATVTVNADLTAPVFLRALSATNLTNIVLSFSEPLDQAVAEDLGNYDVHHTAGGGSLTVFSATLVNNTNVVLHTSPLTTGVNYTVDTFNLIDRAFAQNPVTPASMPLIQTIVVFPFSHVWKYNETGADLGTAWRAVAYDDSAWPSGAGIHGFEDTVAVLTTFTNLAGGNGTNTVLSLTNSVGGGIGGTNVTIYFRTTVSIPNFNPGGPGNSVYARYYIDDGAAVHVNGNPEMYFNLTNGAGYTNFAIAGSTENVLVVSNVLGLVQGNNTIAAEVHQNSLTSSDIDWGMQLEAFVTTFSAAGPTLHVVNNGNGTVTVSWSGGGILQSTTNLQNTGTVWTDVPGNPNPYTFTPVVGQSRFFSLR